MAEWSFQRKMISGVILVCLLAILTSVGSLITSRLLIADMANVATGEGTVLIEARALQLIGLKQIADVHACLLTGGGQYEREALTGSDELIQRAGRLRASIADSVGRVRIDRVVSANQAHQDTFRAALTRAQSPPGRSASDPHTVLESGRVLGESLAAMVARLQSARVRSVALSRSAVYSSERVLIVITTFTIVLLVALCLLLITVLDRSYARQSAARQQAESGQTQARATLSEVESASQLKDEFLATVSHELRNPLAPILTWTQLLRSGTLDAEKSQRALEVIERNVMSQAKLIDDLVDVSRVVSGKFRLDVRPIDLLPVIKAAVEAQAPASDAKQIRLKLVLDERAGVVSGDSERLQQVLWNLISNAIKFTPKGGRVQVVLQRAESHLEIAVIDSGSGIEPDFLPHVFEPFRQGTAGSMRRHGGLGLGLSIVRHIVELHGGEIFAASDGPGQGSRFTLRLPLLATVPAGAQSERRHPIARESLTQADLARLDAVRVLIVEDEPSASEALLVLFLSCGATARAASSAAEALRLFEEWVPDVLVSDIAMPGEDGYALIRQVRLRPAHQGGAVPAVALTAYAKIEDRVSILASGFQMYLSKPADPSELVAVVGSLARRSGEFAKPGD